MHRPQSLFPTDHELGSMTDLYQLTMAAGYHHTGMHERRACFECFIRTMPDNRNYLIAAGLEQALHFLTHLSFSEDQVRWIADQPPFENVPPSFFNLLADLRFDGNAWAIPEGTVVFPHEPILRVEANLLQAQIVETFLLTCFSLPTMVASKAARVVAAAEGRSVADFGARRAHGPMAGLMAARAALIGGCDGTSHVEAARLVNARAVGTQAHSWVMSFRDEQEAFLRYADLFGAETVCLIDTYDTVEGAYKATAVGKSLKGVRLDSGDLVTLSKKVRGILDEAGLTDAKILASGDLNEYRIGELLQAGAPIDLFGVGTQLVTSFDAPAVSIVYKLVACEDEAGRMTPRIKSSSDKATLGGAKQVTRHLDASGKMARDVLNLAEESWEGTPLLAPVIEGGELVCDCPTVQDIAAYAREQTSMLPEALQDLNESAEYPVDVSDALREYQPE